MTSRRGLFLLSLLALASAWPARAADTVPEAPLLVGDFSFLTDAQAGHQQFGPKFEPILLLPLSSRLLVEAEYSMELPVERTAGSLGPAILDHGFEYLQLDYAVSDAVTIVAGHFVTPFGIYKERIDPIWIRNLVSEPLLFPVNDTSSNGVMVRGGIFVTPSVKINYAASVSAATENAQFAADKQTSNRVSLYLAQQKLEIGASYGRKFGPLAYNIYGFDLAYKPLRIPVDIRGEGLWSAPLGNGFWLEGAHRFAGSRMAFLRKSQAVVRGEAFSPTANTTDLVADLPEIKSRRATFGWNYWLTDSLKASVAYSRLWAASQDANVVTLGIDYRFILPLGVTR